MEKGALASELGLVGVFGNLLGFERCAKSEDEVKETTDECESRRDPN